MTAQFFVVRGAKAPWGDYGRILWHGMSAHLPREHGTIQLERTGPFIPPLTFPAADVIATQAARDKLDASGLGGLCWRAVAKRHIVELDWRSWDLGGATPPTLPASGEPEAYVLGRPYAPSVSEGMPALWELEADVFGTGRQQRLGRGNYAITLSVDGAPPSFFRVDGLRHLFASEQAANWLRETFGEWVVLQSVALSG